MVLTKLAKMMIYILTTKTRGCAPQSPEADENDEMAGVPQTKPGFAKNRVFATLTVCTHLILFLPVSEFLFPAPEGSADAVPFCAALEGKLASGFKICRLTRCTASTHRPSKCSAWSEIALVSKKTLPPTSLKDSP